MQLCLGALGALRADSCSAQGTQGGSTSCQLSLTHSLGFSEGLSGSASPHLEMGATICPACYSSFTPAPARPAQRLLVGHKSVLQGYCLLTGSQAAASQDPNQDVGPQRGIHGSARLQVFLSVCHSWQHLPMPCMGLQLLRAHGLRQHRHGEAEDARGSPAVTPSSVAQGLHNPLLPVAGVTEAPSGHTWDSGTCLW